MVFSPGTSISSLMRAPAVVLVMWALLERGEDGEDLPTSDINRRSEGLL